MSHRLQVLIPETLKRRIDAASQRSRMSTGAWVREALDAALSAPNRPALHDPLSALAKLEAPTADIGDMLHEIEAGRS